MNYEAWRATYQNSEQAARAAFDAAQRSHQQLQETRHACLALDANLQNLVAAVIAQGAGPALQAAIDEMPAHSLAKRDAEKQAEAVSEFAKEVWNELFKHYRTIKVFPLTMAKEWCEERMTQAPGIKPETMPGQPAADAGTLGGDHAAN
ncbi:hypothetical protein [Vreelandella sp. EE7]